MDYTQNLNLPQWEADDRIMRTDFNDMTATLDAALAAKSRVACGTYTGDGAESRTIDLDFTPRAVLVLCDTAMHFNAVSSSVMTYGGIALTGQPLYACCKIRDTTHIAADCLPALEVTANGFIVHKSSITINTITYYAYTNLKDYRYRYFAIG